MTETALRVERITPDRISALIGFLDRAYGRDLFSGERGHLRWQWLYERCPAVLEGGLPVWICLDGERIVGHCGALPGEVVAGTTVALAAWARDLIVDPAARGRGVGSQLMATVIRATERCLILGEYEAVHRMYTRLGYLERGRMPLFVKVLRPRELAATLPLPGIGRAIAARVIPVLQARPSIRAASLQVSAIQRFDGHFDRWWSEIEPALGCVVRRTSALLNWRYAQHPSHDYRILLLHRGDDLCGVAVARTGTSRGHRAGHLVELLAHPSDTEAIRSLIGAAEAELAREGVVLLRAAVRHRPVERALLRGGYLPVPSPIRFMVAAGNGAVARDDVLARRDWFLNAGDSDIDFL